ncbi:MAG TPA: imidazoleglycerol-phosphate dehydratase HisB [Steroidobacteraceae bacterium]|nr:imidazoleglycerol-phosphate dehydratase HisB [Steroidobacteraceae bacterium]
MSAATLFIDRDGTLIEEPTERPLESLARVRFMPGVFAALAEASRRGYRLVMVADQDGLGSAAQQFILETFSSQGVDFEAVLVCPELVQSYLREHEVEPQASAVIGDRDTDLQFAANLKVRALSVRRHGAPHETWPAALQELIARRAQLVRETNETRVEVRVDLDAALPLQIGTGIGFFDHMLAQLARHGGFALELSCRGDLHVDEHHTVEDCALALGQALRRALGSRAGIARYGFLLPMDEAEARVAIDLSGRAFAQFSGHFPRETVGALPTELVPHFFRSLAEALGAALHVSVTGENTHHMIEACFKGVGRALRQALQREGTELPSTKGILS